MSHSVIAFICLGMITLIVVLALAIGKFLEEKSPIHPIELPERQREIPGDPTWEDEFRPLVEMVRGRLPDCHVWGQYILNGSGYGIFVTDSKNKSCWQVKTSITVNGKHVDSDVRSVKNIDAAVDEATAAIAKSLNELGGKVGTRAR